MSTVRKTNVLLTRDYTWKFKGRMSEDSATSVLRYKDDFDGWVARCPVYGDEHPDLADFFLTEIEAEREPGDQIAVTLTYEIHSYTTPYPGKPGGEEPTPRYSVAINEGEEHILTSAFADGITDTERKALLNISNGNEIKEGTTRWETDVTSTEGVALLAKIRKGNVSCIADTVVYTESKQADDLDALNYANVRKREAPPGLTGSLAANWLYIGGNASPSEPGYTWTITRNWKFSPDGWDTDLYPEAT